jgi:hypothetical protein
MTPETVREGVIHLTKNDPKLASLIARVGAGALINGKFFLKSLCYFDGTKNVICR